MTKARADADEAHGRSGPSRTAMPLAYTTNGMESRTASLASVRPHARSSLTILCLSAPMSAFSSFTRASSTSTSTRKSGSSAPAAAPRSVSASGGAGPIGTVTALVSSY